MSPTTRLAYLNGQWIDAERLHVPVHDAGFVQGLTVVEQLRTFRGRLFRIDEHLRRLQRSLDIVNVKLEEPVARLNEPAQWLAEHNHRLLSEGDDLALCLFVTPGPYAAMAEGRPPRPLVAMHTYPLPFASWAEKYRGGQALATTSVQQVPYECWPRELKCRSRMHYFLADQAASNKDPQARALLLDPGGWVVEASTANIMIYRADEGLVSPPENRILPGVTLQAWEELASQLKIPFIRRDFRLDALRSADEVMLCSTSMCGLPVLRLDGQLLGDERPGPCFQRLISAWSQWVGVDVVEQARLFSRRAPAAT